MELFVVTQIAAYQRKRIKEHIFLLACPEKCLPLLTAKAVKIAVRVLVAPTYSRIRQPCVLRKRL